MEHASRFPLEIREKLHALAEISSWLRKEREFSFYGDIDFIPTERYTTADAKKAMTDAHTVVEVASRVVR